MKIGEKVRLIIFGPATGPGPAVQPSQPEKVKEKLFLEVECIHKDRDGNIKNITVERRPLETVFAHGEMECQTITGGEI